MVWFFITELIVFIVCLVIEPVHDKSIIETENRLISVSGFDKQFVDKRNRIWHIFDAIGFTLYSSLVPVVLYITHVSTLIQSIILFSCLLLIRLSIFPLSLNFLRGAKLFHNGTKGVDALLNKVFGKSAGVIKTILAIIILIALNVVFIFIS